MNFVTIDVRLAVTRLLGAMLHARLASGMGSSPLQQLRVRNEYLEVVSEVVDLLGFRDVEVVPLGVP